jgi:hypothetical protein
MEDNSMAGYFSFNKMITTSFVKVIYLFGSVALTAAGLALTTWAGLGLYHANISSQIGWRYVAIGAGTAIVGNLVWRIVCELWIVLFNIHARLTSIDDAMHLDRLPTLSFADAIKSQARDKSLPTRVPRETIHETKETYETARHASVLGLS